MTRSPADLCAAAAALFDTRTHCKGAYARHVTPDKTVETLPWDPKASAPTELSVVGALCYAAGAGPDDPAVIDAMRACSPSSRFTLETWNDAPDTTLADVVRVLQTAAAAAAPVTHNND